MEHFNRVLGKIVCRINAFYHNITMLFPPDEVGTATRMKLINNMILGTVMASVAEGMSLAEKVGLDQEDLHDILCLGALNCPLVKHKSQGKRQICLLAMKFNFVDTFVTVWAVIFPFSADASV